MVPRTLLAAFVMGLAVWSASIYTTALAPGLVGQLLAVALPSAIGLAVYALLVTLLRIEEAHDVVRLLLRRRS